MKPRDTALKVKRFALTERTRKVGDLEHMIRDLENGTIDLDRQIAAEEDRTGVKDAGHFAYSTFAKAASQRREKLRVSLEGLKAQLDDARKALETAKLELAALEQAEPTERPRGVKGGPGTAYLN